MFSMWDLANGLFESFAGVFVLLHCRRLYLDKEIKGVSPVATFFFTTWGIFNLAYYPHLEQWLSFFGGLAIVSANMLWICMMVYYSFIYNTPRAMYARTDAELAKRPPAPRRRSALTFD